MFRSRRRLLRDRRQLLETLQAYEAGEISGLPGEGGRSFHREYQAPAGERECRAWGASGPSPPRLRRAAWQFAKEPSRHRCSAWLSTHEATRTGDCSGPLRGVEDRPSLMNSRASRRALLGRTSESRAKSASRHIGAVSNANE